MSRMILEKILYSKDWDVGVNYGLAVVDRDYVFKKEKDFYLDAIEEWDRMGQGDFGQFVNLYKHQRWVDMVMLN